MRDGSRGQTGPGTLYELRRATVASVPMNLKRTSAETISGLFALGRMMSGCRCGFRILLYHAVGSRLARDTYGISIDPALFEQHMVILAESKGVNLVGLNEGQLFNAPLRVAVTFDDGYKDNLYTAAPILLKYKIPFTVFATASFIQRGSTDYLTPFELKELDALPGVTIGSHGATHVPLAECGDSTLWEEVDGSRRYLEGVLGKPVKAISYPHGSVNRRVVHVARLAGFTSGLCSRFDINDQSRDPLLLCRTEVVAADSERVFRQKIQGAWDWLRWRSKDPVTMA